MLGNLACHFRSLQKLLKEIPVGKDPDQAIQTLTPFPQRLTDTLRNVPLSIFTAARAMLRHFGDVVELCHNCEWRSLQLQGFIHNSALQ